MVGNSIVISFHRSPVVDSPFVLFIVDATELAGLVGVVLVMQLGLTLGIRRTVHSISAVLTAH